MSSRIFILTFDFPRAVDAVMLTGNTSKREKDDIKTRLNAMASGNAVREIKLCYVTVRALRFKYRTHGSQQHTARNDRQKQCFQINDGKAWS